MKNSMATNGTTREKLMKSQKYVTDPTWKKQEEIKNLSRLIVNKESECVIKHIWTYKSRGTIASKANAPQHLKIINTFSQYSKKGKAKF